MGIGNTYQFVAAVTITALLVPHISLAQFNDIVAAPPYQQQGTSLGPELEALQTELESMPSHLGYAKYMLLRSKRANDLGTTISGRVYGLKPSGASPLSREYGGSPFTSDFYSLGSSFDSSFDLITGERAVDESLQLGSIGSPRNGGMTWEQSGAHQNIQLELEFYRVENGDYPPNLNQIDVNEYYQEYVDDFLYEKIGESYTLTLKGAVTEAVSIEDVEGLTIQHHPWEQMIDGRTSEVPAIYHLVPDDYLLLHFNDLGRYRELEETLANIQGPLSGIYSLGDALSAKTKIFNRLGIIDNPKLDVFLNEVALISYDFDAYPSTEYALIFGVKSDKLDTFVKSHIDAPEERQGRVGEYYVVATSKDTFEHVQNVEAGREESLADSLDLQYSLVTLEPEKDGFAFMSDAFVEKLTSPEYRIKSARRGAVLRALEVLQYTVFAYRDITGVWPTTFDQIVKDGYMRGGTIYEPEKYTIDANGVVSHSDWGSVYNVTPLSQVSITTAQPAEVDRYNAFREGYQQYWREFIDPVAVNILIGDQVRLHTIILPLIDDSQYNWVKSIVGDGREPLDFVTNPDRIPAIQLTSRLNVNSILFAAYQAYPRAYEIGDEYDTCLDEKYYSLTWSERANADLEELCGEPNKEKAISAVKKVVADGIDWEGDSETIFDFIGDEVSIAGSEQATFVLDDLTKFDFHFGLELTDTKQAKEFVDHLTTFIAEELFGGDSMSFGFFGLSPGKPIRNEYNGTEFYMIPTGWINLFFIYLNNRVYFSVSQTAINNLIDDQGKDWAPHMSRLQDYLSGNPHVSLLVDGTKIQTWLESYAREQVFSYAAKGDFTLMRDYVREIQRFQNDILPEGSNLEDYYSFTPTEWLGIPLLITEDDTLLKTGEEDISLDDIQVSRSYWGDEEEYAFEFDDVIAFVDIEGLIDEWSIMDTFGAGMAMTSEGLDIQVAFNNTERNSYDDRVPSGGGFRSSFTFDKNMLYIGGGVLFVLLLLFVAVGLARRKYGKGGDDFLEGAIITESTSYEPRVQPDVEQMPQPESQAQPEPAPVPVENSSPEASQPEVQQTALPQEHEVMPTAQESSVSAINPGTPTSSEARQGVGIGIALEHPTEQQQQQPPTSNLTQTQIEQVSEYITQARQLGDSDEEIQKALLANGWTDADVNEVFSRFTTLN